MGISADAAAADQFHLSSDDNRFAGSGGDRIAKAAANGGPTCWNGAIAETGVAIEVGGIIQHRPGCALRGLAPLTDIEGFPGRFRNDNGIAHVDLDCVQINLFGFGVFVKTKTDAVEFSGHLSRVNDRAAKPVLVVFLNQIPANFIAAVAQWLHGNGKVVQPCFHFRIARRLFDGRDGPAVVAPGAAPAAVLDGPDHAGAAGAVGHGAVAGSGLKAVAEMFFGADPHGRVGVLRFQSGTVLIGQGIAQMGISADAAAANQFHLSSDDNCLFGGRLISLVKAAANGGPTGRNSAVAKTGVTCGGCCRVQHRPCCALACFAPLIDIVLRLNSRCAKHEKNGYDEDVTKLFHDPSSPFLRVFRKVNICCCIC